MGDAPKPAAPKATGGYPKATPAKASSSDRSAHPQEASESAHEGALQSQVAGGELTAYFSGPYLDGELFAGARHKEGYLGELPTFTYCNSLNCCGGRNCYEIL